MAIFTGTLTTDPPSDLAKLANDGRINLVSSTSIQWYGSVIGLWNGSNWAVCKPATLPSAINTSTDMNGTALAVDKIYDVFLNYSSVTSCPFAFSRWAVHTAGSSARNAAYAAGTAYAIGDRVTYSGRDYTNIQAGTGQTPSSSPTYWVDNGTSVTGDFAGLYKHDGVLVSHNSDAGKKLRWLGNIYTYSNSGTVNFKDDTTYRYISNYYNTLDKTIVANGANAHTITSTTFIENTGTNSNRISIVNCKAFNVWMNGQMSAYGNAAGWTQVSLALNVTNTFSTSIGYAYTGSDTASTFCGNLSLPSGLNFMALVESVTGGTGTVREANFTKAGGTIQC